GTDDHGLTRRRQASSIDDIFTGPRLAAMAIAAVAGVIRGVTGFGGSMVMTPPLALLFGPRAAIAVVLLLEAFAAAPMIPDAARKANWRLMVPLSLSAFVAIPLGGYALAHANPELLRRFIAAV